MKVFRSNVIPNPAPYIMLGLRLAVGRCGVNVVVGELLATEARLGYMIDWEIPVLGRREAETILESNARAVATVFAQGKLLDPHSGIAALGQEWQRRP